MLKDKVAIVTGSSNGIGREIAMVFAAHGAKVVVNYPRPTSRENAEVVVNAIKAAGGEAIAIEANVADFDASKGLIDQTIAAFGRVDVLVNNAGITRDMLLIRMKEEEFDDVIEVKIGRASCRESVSSPV